MNYFTISSGNNLHAMVKPLVTICMHCFSHSSGDNLHEMLKPLETVCMKY